MGPKTFRDTVTSEKAMQNKYIIAGLDDKKIDDLGEKASLKQRKDLQKNIDSTPTNQYALDLKKFESLLNSAGMVSEADEILKVVDSIDKNTERIDLDGNFPIS